MIVQHWRYVANRMKTLSNIAIITYGYLLVWFEITKYHY